MTGINDGLVNIVANLGTDRDKTASSEYVFEPLSQAELLAAYRGAWLPRAVVDFPAQDATRKWRSWQAEQEQIDKIEAVETRLQTRARIERALIVARLFGGSAIYISTGDHDPSRPLVPERTRGVRSLTVLTPQDIRPESVVRDIESEYYGRAEWYVLTSSGLDNIRIHASRLVLLGGAAVPEGFNATRSWEGVAANDGYTAIPPWGDSVLQGIIEAIRQLDSTSANIASLIFEAKVDVFRFSGFADTMARADGDSTLIKRLHAQAAMKGINGAVVIDKEDEYETKNASFSGLDALLDRFSNLVSGASRIPVTRLFGRSAAGLSGTGDGDERVYFDRIGHMQTTTIQPAMAVLDQSIIREALGDHPEEIWYRWNPLRQVTEKERAEIFSATATAARALAGTAPGSEVLPLDALSDALVNELVEQGVLPGLDQKIAEYGTLAEQELREWGEDVPPSSSDESSEI